MRNCSATIIAAMSFRTVTALLLPAVVTLGGGCESPCGEGCSLTETEWALVKTMSPLPDPEVDPTNRYQFDDAAAVFGQIIFFETRYSGPLKIGKSASTTALGDLGEAGKVSCASCHDPKRYFVDTRSQPRNLSLGSAFTARQSPSLVNLPYYKWWGWGGRHDSMWQQASLAIETPTDTAADRCDFAHFVWANYRDLYNATFEPDLPLELDPAMTSSVSPRFPPKCRPKPNAMAPDGPWEKMPPEDRRAVMQILANQGKAVTAYETKLISRNAPFDRFVAGDSDAISPAAKRGLKLFVGRAACVDCHSGPAFTDNQFHNIAVPQLGVNIPPEDLGRFTDIGIYKNHPFNSASVFNDFPEMNRVETIEPATDIDKGKFRTQTLRNVAMTAPYMHTGGFATLTEVVEFYNEGGAAQYYSGEKSPRQRPLKLSEEEIADLVEFLETLTGEPIPEELTVNPMQ